MRSSSMPGFDLRDAVDSLREAFGPRASDRPSGARAGRGDIRTAILIELSVEPMHGYQIIQAIENRSGGEWKPSPGSIYPTLQLLADEALVSAAQIGERKVYSLTEAGRIVAAEATDGAQQSEPRRGKDGQSTVTLAKSSAKLAQALAQFPRNGSTEQSERAVAIIDEARRKLYAILAED